MNTIRALEQKGQELKQRIAKFGAPFGNKNAAGPHDGRSLREGPGRHELRRSLWEEALRRRYSSDAVGGQIHYETEYFKDKLGNLQRGTAKAYSGGKVVGRFDPHTGKFSVGRMMSDPSLDLKKAMTRWSGRK